VIDLKQFFFDRVWIKAYPAFFKCIRIDPTCHNEYRKWKEDGLFELVTEYAFRLYRTLDCVRLARKKGYDLQDLDVKKCREVRRYGEQDYWEFVVTDEEVIVDVGGNTYRFPLSVVYTVRLIMYPRKVGDRVVMDKYIYLAYSDWLKIAVRPYTVRFEPMLLRVFYNPLVRTREELGIELPRDWKYTHGNWIPVEMITEDVIRRNHELVFDPWLKERIRDEWRKWFIEDVDLAIRVSQVEICRDVETSKDELILGLHGLHGYTRTLKYDARNLEFHEADLGVKYYVTVKRGLQVKVYTKAIGPTHTLNRLEYTVSVRTDFGLIRPEDVFRIVSDVHADVVKGLGNRDVVEEIRRILRPIVKCQRKCDLHYSLWLDLLLLGCIKGTRLYSHIVQIYKRLGYVKTKGRGKYSQTCINENMLLFDVEKVRKKILELLGVVGLKQIDFGRPPAADKLPP